ncbi:hypothetical protein MN608_04019 [Microdochium nivale]|nr:hypothetical protein MN608_04019 [Microdochium nivale]
MASPTPQGPGLRSYTGIIADRISGWLYGMPPETCDFTIEDIRIPVPTEQFAPSITTTATIASAPSSSDTNSSSIRTIELAAILYQPTNQPAAQAPLGTILVRSPYGLDYPLAVGHARIYAARGYQVLLSACRGTAGSGGGEFTPALGDVADGSATALWMRRQSWYTGRWAMLGGSYLGWTQWATVHGLQLREQLGSVRPSSANGTGQDSVHASDDSGGDDAVVSAARDEASAALRELKAMCILVGPHDWGAYTFGTGAMNPDMVSWVGAMAALERKESWLPPPFHMSWHRDRMARDLRPAGEGKSLMQGMQEYIGGNGLPEWFRGIVTGELALPACTEALGRVEGVAVLIVAGWADAFLDQSLTQYRELSKRQQTVGLTIGPWGHMAAQGGQSRIELLQWLDQYLAPVGAVKAKQDARKARVRIYDTGSKEWLETEHWDDSTTTPRKWFLVPQAKLTLSSPAAEEQPTETSFEYDPRDPTPTIGASMLNYQAGKLDDDSSLAARKDVLTFTTEPLEQDLRVQGAPVASLSHTTSHPHADLFVRVSNVEASNVSHNISEGYRRLDNIGRGGAGQDDVPFELTLTECVHTFRKGTRIRLVVAGGSHPKYVRNSGSGNDMVQGVEVRPVTHTIRHGGPNVSSLVLPVVA